MDLSNLLNSVIANQVADTAADKLGVSKSQAQSVISMGLPLIMGALNKNSNDPKGAEGILNAVTSKHDGSILDNISGFLGSGDFSDGAGILGHVLGGSENNVGNAISQKTGISTSQVISILSMLAPIIMGFLGKETKQNNVSSPSGISDMLTGFMGGMQQQTNKDMSMVEKLLDQDGDGSAMDDVMDIGGKLLGGLFKK